MQAANLFYSPLDLFHAWMWNRCPPSFCQKHLQMVRTTPVQSLQDRGTCHLLVLYCRLGNDHLNCMKETKILLMHTLVAGHIWCLLLLNFLFLLPRYLLLPLVDCWYGEFEGDNPQFHVLLRVGTTWNNTPWWHFQLLSHCAVTRAWVHEIFDHALVNIPQTNNFLLTTKLTFVSDHYLLHLPLS